MLCRTETNISFSSNDNLTDYIVINRQRVKDKGAMFRCFPKYQWMKYLVHVVHVLNMFEVPSKMKKKDELNYRVTVVRISRLIYQNRVSSSHNTLEICSCQFQTLTILCELLRRLHVKSIQQIQPIINYWLTQN